jgi:hypothetical protein
MFEDFQCHCIYVEISNDSVPGAGRVEYRAKLCTVCRARGAMPRADGRAAVAFDPHAPRYQRTH